VGGVTRPELRLDGNVLRANIAAVQRRIAPSELMIVVKDDAYGHGLPWAVETAIESGVTWIGSFDVRSAIDVRRVAGGGARIFAWVTSTDAEIDEALLHDVDLGIGTADYLDRVIARATAIEVRARVHLKIDSGLHRNGILPEDWADAVATARAADLALVVVGDRAGLFGRGTVGEGNDVDTLDLPGVQRELVEAIVETGTPVVLVAMTGRPYALDWALPPRATPGGASAGLGAVNSPAAARVSEEAPAARRPAAVLQTFFPGEEGAPALARLLTGRVDPSGRLPVSLPRSAGAQPYSYLHPVLGGRTDITSVDPTPVRPFGFGLGYTSFTHTAIEADATVVAGASFRVAVEVNNVGGRDGVDVVQLYAHDEVASVVRPVAQLIGFERIRLAAGESRRVTFDVPTERLAFTGRDGVRRVEPGRIRLWVGEACDHEEAVTTIEIVTAP